jgi:ParB family chromosome partitioning protein
MTVMIAVASIDAGNRLRTLDPAWVNLLAEEIAADGLQEPIRVVERADGYRLIAGARRLAAHVQLGRQEIAAIVKPAGSLATDAELRLAEIKAEMLHGDLTVLERGRYLAAWREAHEQLHPPPKRGRKPAKAGADALQELSAQCANIFSDAAKAALGLSQRTIYLLLKIASIDVQAAATIARHPSADKRGELLLLAEQSAPMQVAIASMLTAEPAQAETVAEALALLGATSAAQPEPVYARLSERFARLPEREQFAFFALHEDVIDLWIAQRPARSRKAA